jgi:hypothetical protein
MSSVPPRRRRRRRGKRAPDGPRAYDAQVAPAKPGQADEPWQWRTFPVFFAFAIGTLIMGLLIWIAPGAFYIFLIGALFFTVFGLAHYFGRALREYRSEDEG